MKKTLLLFAVLGWVQVEVQAQINPVPNEELAIEDKLVQLAWNTRSEQSVIQSEIAIADQQVKLAKWAWAENLRTSFNLNEFTIQGSPDSGERPLFFPRYNFNLALVLGDAISNPAQIKIAKQQRLITQAQRANAQLDLKAEVLEAYYNYRLSVSLYQISTEQNEEAYTNFLMVSEKFKTGEETLEVYNGAQQTYNAARADLAKLETQVKIAQLQLERYIGVPLEQVLTEEN
ncbi:MAG: TolC family protein [Tunicatimonas sp.]